MEEISDKLKLLEERQEVPADDFQNKYNQLKQEMETAKDGSTPAANNDGLPSNDSGAALKRVEEIGTQMRALQTALEAQGTVNSAAIKELHAKVDSQDEQAHKRINEVETATDRKLQTISKLAEDNEQMAMISDKLAEIAEKLDTHIETIKDKMQKQGLLFKSM